MAGITAFNPKVAARTRAATQMLTADLLAAYEAVGGSKEDLEAIRDDGLRAEVLNLAQSRATAGAVETTARAIGDFIALQREYGMIMAVAQAARGDAQRAGQSGVAVELQRVLDNEAPPVSRAAEAGAPAKRSRKSQSYEAVRAEIEKDAGALLAMAAAQPLLAKRGVTSARLTNLQKAARALAGTLGEASTKRGAAKGATQAEREAVAAQSERWSSCYRLFALVGAKNTSVAALLKAAAG